MNRQLIIAATFMSILSASCAFNYNVNWVQSPKESLNAWSSRMRFQINDRLVFKVDNQSSSVLVVTKEDYDSCSGSNPIDKVQGSKQLTRSGPYYFISSDAQKCMSGQKMVVVVLSPRGKKPAAATPMVSPAMAPSSSSMSPLASPSMAPTMAPSTSMAPSPSSMAPSMTPSGSMAPSMSPSSSPMAPVPFTAAPNKPGQTGSEVPAPAPMPMSAGSALGVASVTIVMAIVGIVILA